MKKVWAVSVMSYSYNDETYEENDYRLDSIYGSLESANRKLEALWEKYWENEDWIDTLCEGRYRIPDKYLSLKGITRDEMYDLSYEELIPLIRNMPVEFRKEAISGPIVEAYNVED